MGEIVNLNHARKAKARGEREREAAENRRRFGQTKAERDKAQRQAEKAWKDHEGNRLD